MEISSVFDNYVLPEPPPMKQNQLDQTAFLRLLVVQLATQNPLEPMNDRDFFAQLAQFGMVNGIDQLKNSLQVSQAASLIGRTVEVFSPLSENGQVNATIQGVVESVEIANQKVYLRINGVRYEMDRLVRILQ